MPAREVSSKAEFDSALKAAGTNLVVVDFHATWCGPCKAIAPTYASLANKHTSSVFLKVDVDAVPDVASRYQVRAMPTFLFLRSSAIIDQLRGADPSKLTALVAKYSSASGSGDSSFAGRGQSLAGSSGAAAGARAVPVPTGEDALAKIKAAGLENLLPIAVAVVYLVYVLYK